MAPAIPTTTLYRPVGQAELDLIEVSGTIEVIGEHRAEGHGTKETTAQ